MFKPSKNSLSIWQGFALAGIVAGSVATAPAAFAGECPADKMKPNVRAMVDYKPVGVTDVTLGSIDLEKQPAHLKDRELRFRELTIEPGIGVRCDELGAERRVAEHQQRRGAQLDARVGRKLRLIDLREEFDALARNVGLDASDRFRHRHRALDADDAVIAVGPGGGGD